MVPLILPWNTAVVVAVVVGRSRGRRSRAVVALVVVGIEAIIV